MLDNPIAKAIKKIIPVLVKDKAKDILGMYHHYQCKRAIETATGGPTWLNEEELLSLVTRYTFESNYQYEEPALYKRGTERCIDLQNRIPNFDTVTQFLELGCYDGVVCYLLNKNFKKQATGIDWRDEAFDKEALKNGTRLMQMDAQATSFEDHSFDVIFSYDSFEHFSKPDLVLKDAYRVLKPGGYMYLDFGPLYPSPWGLHTYSSLPVPYCQFLFSQSTMKDYFKKYSKGEFWPDYVNGWSIDKFNQLWKQYDGKLEIVDYKKILVSTGKELILQYPNCFKGKYDSFDSLFTSGINILLRKKD